MHTRHLPSALSLVLDVQAIQSEAHSERGIARFVSQHAQELLQYEDLVRALTLNPNRPFPKNPNPALLFSERLVWGGLPALTDAVNHGPTAYYTMSPVEFASIETLHPRSVAGRSAYYVTTLYDLIPLLFPDVYLRDRQTRLQYLARLELFKASDLVCAISQSAKDDAVRHLHLNPAKVHVIGGGVSPFFNAKFRYRQDVSLIRHYIPELRGQFIFTVMGEDPRKNLDRLLHAYARLPLPLRRQYQLIIGGSYREAAIQNIFAQHPEETSAGRVLFSRFIPDECLRSLYRTCSLFIFPSLYEGFGLPVAEAAACGARIITSNTSSLPEVLEAPSTTFDPHDVDAICSAMERGLTDRKYGIELRRIARDRASQLSWQQVAKRTLEGLATLEKRRKLVTFPRRLTVALVGPFPPVKSGIADYNYYLARELAKLVDLHIFYTKDSDPARLRGLRIAGCRPVSDLADRQRPAYFHHVIYTLGNSEHHIETYELALRFPGLVWLHDVRLFGFYYNYCLAKAGAGGKDMFLRETHRMYPNRIPPVCTFQAAFDLGAVRDWGVGYTLDVVRAARSVILNSETAHHLLKLDQGPGATLPPACVIPHACHDREMYPEAADQEISQCSTVISLGLVDWVKGPDLLIDAVAIVNAVRKCNLVFVGPVSDTLRDELLERANRLGIADRLQFTNYVDEDEWFRWVIHSHCAVQLRRRTNGESSGAVLSCLPAGVPVITNVASCQEMPEDSRDFVPFDVSPEELSEHILLILSDHQARTRLQRGGLRYASDHNYAKTAARLVNFLERSASNWDDLGPQTADYLAISAGTRGDQ